MDATQIWYESDEINSCVTVGRVILLLDAVLLGCGIRVRASAMDTSWIITIVKTNSSHCLPSDISSLQNTNRAVK
jgi:hypothetical protein